MYNISKIISKPYTFDKIESDKLAELSVKYPFFQTANILLCKALYDSKSIKFKSQLKKAAAQSANRSTLFKILIIQILRFYISHILLYRVVM